MQLNYKGMSTEDVYPRIEAWQDFIDVNFVDHILKTELTGEEIGKLQVKLQEDIVSDWQVLADHLVAKWLDMRRTGASGPTRDTYGFTEWYAKMVGFSNDIHPIWVKPSEKPPVDVPGYVAPTVSIPRDWV